MDNGRNGKLGSSGINIDEMKKAAQNGKIEDYINKTLSQDAANKLKNILSDKKATEKLLSTPEAKELMNKLKKG